MTIDEIPLRGRFEVAENGVMIELELPAVGKNPPRLRKFVARNFFEAFQWVEDAIQAFRGSAGQEKT